MHIWEGRWFWIERKEELVLLMEHHLLKILLIAVSWNQHVLITRSFFYKASWSYSFSKYCTIFLLSITYNFLLFTHNLTNELSYCVLSFLNVKFKISIISYNLLMHFQICMYPIKYYPLMFSVFNLFLKKCLI